MRRGANEMVKLVVVRERRATRQNKAIDAEERAMVGYEDNWLRVVLNVFVGCFGQLNENAVEKL